MILAFYALQILAVAGLVLSLIVHTIAVMGMPLAGDSLVWAIHIGIFVLCIPTILVVRLMRRRIHSRHVWRTVLRDCPYSVKWTILVFFAYAVFNFALFPINIVGQPLPAIEAVPLIVRCFSALWMLFYAAVFATLHSAVRLNRVVATRHCPRGHVVSRSATFCVYCGAQLESEKEVA